MAGFEPAHGGTKNRCLTAWLHPTCLNYVRQLLDLIQGPIILSHMKVIHVASEMHPVAKVGGLADVVHGLSKELIRMGHEVEVILPKYESLLLSHVKDLQKIDNRWHGKVDHVPVTFLEMEDISLKRIYGEPDDPARFIAFCKEAAAYIKKADIIHLHDWPTSLLATLTNHKTLLTIHNMQHQGICAGGIGLPDPILPEKTNLLRTGIENVDIVTTVSPTYAREILTTQKGCNLQAVLKKKGVIGILNGIDIDWWNPKIDPHLPVHFPPNVTEAKMQNRIALQKELQMAPPKGKLVAAITRLDPQKGPALIRAGLHHTLKKGHQFILLGTPSTPEMQSAFTLLQKEYADNPNIHFHFQFDHSLGHKLYAASDLILIPSIFEPCGLTQMLAMRYGTLPLVRKTGGLADTVFEKKNGFVFEKPDAVELTNALDRAFSCNDKTWEKLRNNALEKDFSWTASAKEYLTVYRATLC